MWFCFLVLLSLVPFFSVMVPDLDALDYGLGTVITRSCLATDQIAYAEFNWICLFCGERGGAQALVSDARIQKSGCEV